MNTKPALLSAHPIDDSIRARVLQALDQIEAEQVGWVREATHRLSSRTVVGCRFASNPPYQ